MSGANARIVPGQGPDAAFELQPSAEPLVLLTVLVPQQWPIVTERHDPGDSEERAMSHQPPKENKKKPQHTPKEKKAIKQQKKHASDAAPFIKH